MSLREYRGLREPVFRLRPGTAAGDLLLFWRRQYLCQLEAIRNCPRPPSTRDVALVFGVSDLCAREMISVAFGEPYRQRKGETA